MTVVEERAVELAARAAARRGLVVKERRVDRRPLGSVRFVARAATDGLSPLVAGYGSGTREQARVVAVMECLERQAQFREDVPSADAVASAQELEPDAISPAAFGLYDRAQYAAPTFPCAPFVPSAPLEWVEVEEVEDGTPRLVPIEFVYPNVPLPRRRLACETSSGCAAHIGSAQATLAAVCELIERDAAMLFWYRQPETALLTIDGLAAAGVADKVDGLRRLGYVVAVGDLDYDLGIPCFLALALQGNRFAYGLGCAADARSALAHALGELASAIAWLDVADGEVPPRRAIADVKHPRDHFGLYDGGPRHELLRQVLARTLRPPPADGSGPDFSGRALPAEDALDAVTAALGVRGLRAYRCDVAPPDLREVGLHVVRAFVPGLIPLHFGSDHLRLGCERLTGSSAPGRLRQLLPHFLR